MIKKTIKGKISKNKENIVKKAKASVVKLSVAIMCEECDKIAYIDGKCLECGHENEQK